MPVLRPLLLMLSLASPGLADQAAYRFTWQGAGGFEMRGALAFDKSLLGQEAVTARDVDCFTVEGYRDGAPVGRWALGMLNEETDWILTFHPATASFAVYTPGLGMPQAWNMDGYGTSCGEGGFGFNIGSQAQDICIGGQLMWESQVPPPRPFPATRDDSIRFPADACNGPLLLGALTLPEGAAALR